MSSQTTSRSSGLLARISLVSGLGAGLVLLVNAAKRAEIIPLVPATQLVAPMAQIFSLGLVIGLFATFAAMRGKLGTIATALYIAALAALVGVEFVINLVFPYVDGEIIDMLRDGPLGTAFIVASMTFLTGTLLFFAAVWRVPGSPRIAIVLAVVTSFPIALRTAFPEIALQVGLVGLAAALVWLTVWMARADRDQ